MKTLKLQLLHHNYINYKQFVLCPMKIHHAVPEKGYDQLLFFLNAITEDKMSLRISALAYFIQNRLYLQYIFIILL